MPRSPNRKRAGKFIAVANMKGGVGKTTTVVSLAEALAADDLEAAVLVVDLDPQASASVCIAGDTLLAELIDGERTVEAFLDARLLRQESAELQPLIRSNISTVTHRGQQLNLSLLPCGPHLRIVERELLYELTNRNMSMSAIDGKIWRIFSGDFDALRDAYDYIIFDCAPGISPVTEAAVRIADLVIVPTIPDYLSVYGLNAFHGAVWAHKSATLPKPKSAPFILISRLQPTRQHRAVREILIEGANKGGTFYRMIETCIPQFAGLPDALMRPGYLSFTQKYTSAFIAETMQPLVTEIKGLL